MTKIIQAWMMKRYSMIWSMIADKEFTFDWYLKTTKDDVKVALIVLSRLRRFGWVEVKNNPKDSRKKIYHLVNPHLIFSEIGSEVIIK